MGTINPSLHHLTGSSDGSDVEGPDGIKLKHKKCQAHQAVNTEAMSKSAHPSFLRKDTVK